MVRVVIDKIFKTEAEARSFLQRTLNSYHPAGYGTTLKVSRTELGWRVHGHRYDSCD